MRSGLAVAPDEVLAELRALVADDPPEVRSKLWYDMLAPVFGYGDSELARQIYERFDRHAREDENPWDEADRKRSWMRPWIAASPDSPTAPSQGHRTFAVMDYGHPGADRASANLGDHIQSIASLGHLVRHQGVRLHGRDELAGLLERLRSRTRPERRLSDVDADLDVITVHRDASMYESIPEDTWTLCFGWFMHALFGIRHGFPLHRNLRPIFVSFHCNKRGLLTPEAIEYLKRYGPVGCRDWNTVYLLLSLDVPAFFSGCLTTTIDTVFPELPEPPPRDAPAAYVDVDDVPEDAVAYQHSDEEVRVRPFVVNVERALELLETYRGEHSGVVTSRLHCYLPVRSIGADVEFRPANWSDIRFDGLVGLDDDAFAAMRDDIDGKLEQVFRAILTGRSEDEVYALWRELTADRGRRGRAARARGRAAGAGDRPRAALRGRAPEDRHARRNGSVVRPSTARSSCRRAPSARCRCWSPRCSSTPRARCTSGCSGCPAAAGSRSGSASASPRSRSPGCGPARSARSSAGGRDVARLLLADLLPDVDRLVVLPIPAVATADVAELADLDLGGHALAAPLKPGTKEVSGFGVIHNAALRLEDRTERGGGAAPHGPCAAPRSTSTPSRTTCSCSTSRACAPSASASERSSWCSSTGSTTSRCCTTSSGRGAPSCRQRWAVVPTRMPQREPGLLHWADGVKPWQPELTPERERWRAYRTS